MHPWHRLEQWLKANAPKVYRDLLDPATEEEIQAAEAALGVKLTKAMVDAYLTYNGQDKISLAVAGEWQVLSLEAVVVQWKIQKKLLDSGTFAGTKVKTVGPVRPVWWSDKWVLSPTTAAAISKCVDLDLAQGGTGGKSWSTSTTMKSGNASRRA